MNHPSGVAHICTKGIIRISLKMLLCIKVILLFLSIKHSRRNLIQGWVIDLILPFFSFFLNKDMTLTLSTSVFSLLVKPTTQLSCSFGPLGKLDFYYSERIWSFIHFFSGMLLISYAQSLQNSHNAV